MESATNSFFIAEDLSNEILESDLSKFFENGKMFKNYLIQLNFCRNLDDYILKNYFEIFKFLINSFSKVQSFKNRNYKKYELKLSQNLFR
jgi:hypothetical protein